MNISSAVKDDIYWKQDNISPAYNVILKSNSDLTLITDASKLGWGAVLGAFFHKWKFYIERNRIVH